MTELSDVIVYTRDRLEANKATLGLVDVFLGDQSRIPRTPAVAVEPGDARNIIEGAPRRVNRTHIFFLMVYHGKIQSGQVNRLEAQLFSEAVARFIHDDPIMNDAAFGAPPEGWVYNSLVTVNESGFSTRENTMLVTNRLTVEASSREQLPRP